MILIFKLLILTYVLSNMFSILFELKPYVKWKPLQFLMTKLYCWKCLSFWLTLFLTKDIYISSQVSLLAMICDAMIFEIN